MITIRRALLSVSDKSGIEVLGKALAALGIEILSTGNTAKALNTAGVAVTKVSDYTGSPEILDGRVKTLHPRIHGGLLARRDLPAHLAELEQHGIGTIDLVVVNLYPFRETVRKPNVNLTDAVENIDIGGPCMIRAAAKNHSGVVVVVNPGKYESLITELQATGGKVSSELSRQLAVEAFSHTAAYDAAIASYLADTTEHTSNRAALPQFALGMERVDSLRYGENAHQSLASVCRDVSFTGQGLMDATIHQGKQLSYNNFLDFQAAWDLCREFAQPAAVLIKHNNPCGVATAPTLFRAFQEAHACDPLSAFGGVFALNREVDAETAAYMDSTGFFEGVLAPAFSPEALAILGKKADRRLLSLPEAAFFSQAPRWEFRQILGGFLVQERDIAPEEHEIWRVVTQRQPSAEELAALHFAWTVAKHVKSNAIVLVKGTATVGIGAGQMSRVDSTTIAGLKAKDRAAGSVLASDAFFPFRDGVDQAAKVGATAMISPGGSVRDKEVIAACNEHNMAMIFTGRRHFRH